MQYWRNIESQDIHYNQYRLQIGIALDIVSNVLETVLVNIKYFSIYLVFLRLENNCNKINFKCSIPILNGYSNKLFTDTDIYGSSHVLMSLYKYTHYLHNNSVQKLHFIALIKIFTAFKIYILKKIAKPQALRKLILYTNFHILNGIKI